MRTYSHFLFTVGALALANHGVARGGGRLTVSDQRAALLGSVLPDAPLLLLGACHFAAAGLRGEGFETALTHFQHNYFNDPLWQASHSLLHAPACVLLLMAVGWCARSRVWARRLLCFSFGAAGHVLVDVPTHFDDGPLLLFPFDWSVRFQSPLSYWDPAHHGLLMTWFEHGLDLVIGLALWLRRGARVASPWRLIRRT